MARRNQYKVILDKTKFAAPHELEVFADEILMTQTGDVVFNQIRDVKVLNPRGEMEMIKDMQNVLTVTAGTFVRIVQINEHGGELYKESGAISVPLQ